MQKKWINIILVLLGVLALLFVWNKISIDEETIPTTEVNAEEEMTLPEGFEAFYDSFHNDSVYQMQHIVWPLHGIAVNDSSENINYQWSADNWTIHKPFDDMGGTFNVQYEILGDMVTEKISAAQYNFSMARRFAKMDGEYHLIYYKEMGPG